MSRIRGMKVYGNDQQWQIKAEYNFHRVMCTSIFRCVFLKTASSKLAATISQKLLSRLCSDFYDIFTTLMVRPLSRISEIPVRVC